MGISRTYGLSNAAKDLDDVVLYKIKIWAIAKALAH